MRINSGNLGMDSARLYKSSTRIQSYTESSSMSGTMTTGSQLGSLFNQFLTTNEENTQSEEAPPSEESTVSDALAKLSANTKTKIYTLPRENSAANQFQKLREDFLKKLLELIFKKKHGCKKEQDASQVPEEFFDEGHIELVTTNNYYEEIFEECEYTSFSAKGCVCTDDGRQIDIDINVNMSSRFMNAYSECLTTLSYELVDPLVVNFSGTTAGLTDISYFFDLDCDGIEEEIHSLSEKSGYLALDKNGDGKINDGSELFGTKSGDGFKDLAAYDEDGNGWIDENDAIFDMLRILVRDSEGNETLYSLKDKDIGAIALQHERTEFGLRNRQEYAMNGYIRSTGIFLYESGEAGTIQHLDLAT